MYTRVFTLPSLPTIELLLKKCENRRIIGKRKRFFFNIWFVRVTDKYKILFYLMGLHVRLLSVLSDHLLLILDSKYYSLLLTK